MSGPRHSPADAQIEAEYRAQMNGIAEALDKVFNAGSRGAARKVGFTLLVYPFGERSGRCNYISNGADRKDIAAMCRELAARFEGQPEMTGNG